MFENLTVIAFAVKPIFGIIPLKQVLGHTPDRNQFGDIALGRAPCGVILAREDRDLASKSKKSKIWARTAALAAKAAAKPAKTIAAGKALIASAKSNGKTAAALLPESVAVRIAIEVLDGTPTYYANFIEIGHTKWDFSLIFAKLPPKPTAGKIAEMQATGTLALPAETAINFPPTLMMGLIRALTIQKEAYEKENKVELKETNDEPTGQGKKRRGRRGSSSN
jgi:hypothetical protein